MPLTAATAVLLTAGIFAQAHGARNEDGGGATPERTAAVDVDAGGEYKGSDMFFPAEHPSRRAPVGAPAAAATAAQPGGRLPGPGDPMDAAAVARLQHRTRREQEPVSPAADHCVGSRDAENQATKWHGILSWSSEGSCLAARAAIFRETRDLYGKDGVPAMCFEIEDPNNRNAWHKRYSIPRAHAPRYHPNSLPPPHRCRRRIWCCRPAPPPPFASKRRI